MRDDEHEMLDELNEMMPLRVIITGASGWLAREIAMQLRELMPEIYIIGVSRHIKEDPLWDSIFCNSDYIKHFFHKSGDAIVHCAFCRMDDGEGLADSLEWSRIVFGKAMAEGASRIVNVSSQSVYNGGALTNIEEKSVSPGYLYAMAKASSEILLRGMAEASNYKGSFTSMRFASLIGVSDSKCPNNVIRKFVVKALRGEPIEIIGGRQKFSFLSIHDAGRAVICALQTSSYPLSPAYNIGPDEQTTIVYAANLIAKQASMVSGKNESEIVLRLEDIELDAGLRSELAHRELCWLPKESFEDIVNETIEFVTLNSSNNI